MQKLVKKFFDNGIDADLAEHLVPPNSYISGNDFRIGTTDKGGAGYIENILKNAEKFHTLPSGGTNIRIGFAADDENGWIIKFNFNSIGDHGVYLYDIIGDLWYTVLLDADVDGGLNFDKYHLINGAFIINEILYFNDYYNEPRSINLGAFISAYGASPLPSPAEADYVVSLPVDYTEITLIKKGPSIPPAIFKEWGSTFDNNFIANDSFQFAVRWKFFTGEETVLNDWSASSFLNDPNQTFNVIRVVVDGTEIMPQGVRLVQLIVKPSSTGKAFVIKTWDRLVPSEKTEIDNQALSFVFYGNINGEPIDSPSLVRPFYSVPLLSGSMAPGKNRILLGNNLEGYDTPLTTSLSATLTSQSTGGTSSVVKNLVEVRLAFGLAGPNNDYAYGGWYVYLNEGGVTPGYYLVNGTEKTSVGSVGGLDPNQYYYFAPSLDPPPATASPASLTFRGDTVAQVQENVGNAFSGGQIEGSQFYTRATTISVLGLSVTVYNIIKSNSIYKLGVVFYDRYLRKCGVVFTDDIVSIPKRNYSLSSVTTSINWTLGYSNVLEEIPDWAYYYQVVRTLNLRTRYFIESYDEEVRYATRGSDGLLDFTGTTYTINTVAIGINSKALLQANLGYVFSEGDQAIIIDDSNNLNELPVIGQEGEYILLKPKDIGNTTSKKFVYEVYVPYKTSEHEPFYGMGQMLKVTNPGTSLRTYGTLSGVFRYDAFAFTRNYNATAYFAEAMNPNDTYFERWDTDAGKPSLITKLGQKQYETGVRFSNVIIDETQTNGLSAFEALNRETLPEGMGTITKLVQAAKVQKDGNIILALCEQEAASVYLGETEVFDAEGNSFLAKSDKFIGQVNVLKGGFGCSNHESVVAFHGQVAWYSKKMASFVVYSNNGVYPISENGMKRVANLFTQDYSGLSVSEIEALGSRPFIFGGVDPFHDEIYFSIPSTLSTPPKGYLPDYVSPDIPIVYPYDIYDGTAKVLVYQLKKDRWAAPHNYQTEGFIDIRNFLFSSKNGSLYKHNTDDGTANTYSKWYGANVIPSIGFILNEDASDIKEYLTLSVEGNFTPTFVQLRCELPNVQDSDAQSQSEFTIREGVAYLPIKRDRLSPNVTGTYDQKLYTGDKMRGQYMKVFVEFETNALIQIRFFNVGYSSSLGQKT